ncbi:MAG: hypothetical protein Q8P41_17005 [Pseudomonadota bacterium]|nr:hypothetical protein [Pseudomonadota bacterium]
MLLTLLFGAAFARPPQLSLAIGPAIGGGESARGTWFTAAPATAVAITWHLGPLESWVGASGSLLMAGVGDAVVPSSLLQGELGLGLGGAGFGAGLYGGNGYPGSIVGLYARATVPRPGWMHRVGLESRLFYTAETDSTGLSLMVRVEPAWGRRARVEARKTGGAEGQPAVEAPEQEGEAAPGEVLAYPVDGVPPAESPEAPAEAAPSEAAPAEPAHHEEPY